MLTMFAIGIVLLGATAAIHAFGSMGWIEHLIKRYAARDGQWRSGTAVWCLISTAIVLMLLLLLEAFVWALAYLALPETPHLETLEEAVYFSLVTFTTLGYGDITLVPKWRVLSSIEAVNGLLLAGWSTALLFTVVQRSWKMTHQPKQKKK